MGPTVDFVLKVKYEMSVLHVLRPTCSSPARKKIDPELKWSAKKNLKVCRKKLSNIFIFFFDKC